MFNAKPKASFTETVSTHEDSSIIGAGTTINGNIESTGDLRIDGNVNGDVVARAKVFVGQDGLIDGNIHCSQADVLGKVTGKIVADDLLQLRGKSVVTGDVFAGKLQIEPTATFNGQCHMGANVVELKATTEMSNAVNL